jgi:UDP-N-acetylglucosamine 2-epimerase (non-hydrolysing)/GDP/UDP-N,N'-diacetylbacillosamine 2-epimerase (hydrolysing)
MTLRVTAVTGGRADYGLLSVLLQRLAADPRFELRLIVTGQHLAPNAGTLQQIAADGLAVDDKVDILLASDTALAVCKTTGLAVIGLAESLERQKPDLILVLGDRYEIFAAALAAHVLRIPIAHIAGGDVTEGAIDDALRHGITKLAHLHFVTTAEAGRRVRQLGEDPARVHVVGSPGLDRIAKTEIPDRATFFREINATAFERNIVVTFHPVTAHGDSVHDVNEMLAALDGLGPEVGLIFTAVNADTQGRTVEQAIDLFCTTRANATLHRALGSRLYFAALTYCDMMVGNSSSGLYEAPTFQRPTVNIGDRQAGRAKAASVIDCPPQREAIVSAMRRAFDLDCTAAVNPYGDGNASERIVEVLANVKDPRALLIKSFHDLKSQ